MMSFQAIYISIWRGTKKFTSFHPCPFRCIVVAYVQVYVYLTTSCLFLRAWFKKSIGFKNTPIDANCFSLFSRRLELQHLPILTSIWGYNVWKHFWTNSTSWSYIAPITLMRMMTLLEKIGNGIAMKKTMKMMLIKMNIPRRKPGTMMTWTKVQWPQSKLSYLEKSTF